MYDMKNLGKFQRYGELAPEAFRAFVAFDEAAYKAGAIPHKYKELIAVATAHITQCPYCIDTHTKRAKAAGATDEEVAESIFVAMALRAGGSFAHSSVAMEALEHK